MKVGDRGTLDKQLTAEQRAEGVNCLFMPSTMVYDILEVMSESEIKVRACGQIVSDIVPSSVFNKNTYAEWDVKRDFPLKKKARKQSGSSEEQPKHSADADASNESTEPIPKIDDKVCLREDKTKTGYVEDILRDDEFGSFLLVDEKWVDRSKWMLVLDKNGLPHRAPEITISFPHEDPVPELTTEEIERRNERKKKWSEDREKRLQRHEKAFQNLPANKKEIVHRIRQICGKEAVLIWEHFAGDNYLCTIFESATTHIQPYGELHEGSLPLKRLLEKKNACIRWESDNYFVVPNVYFTNPTPTKTCVVNVNVSMDYEDTSDESDFTGSLHAHIDFVWPKEMIECGFAYFMMRKIEGALGKEHKSELADEVNALAKDFKSNLAYVSPAFNNRKDFCVELGLAVYFDGKAAEKSGFYEPLDLNSEYGIQIVKEYRFYTSAVLAKLFEKYFKGPTAATKHWVYEYDHPCHVSFWERIIPKYKTTHELPITFKEWSPKVKLVCATE